MVDLDEAIKGKHHSKDTIIDLKRITDKQLKEIVTLQKEIDIVKYSSNTPI